MPDCQLVRPCVMPDYQRAARLARRANARPRALSRWFHTLRWLPPRQLAALAGSARSGSSTAPRASRPGASPAIPACVGTGTRAGRQAVPGPGAAAGRELRVSESHRGARLAAALGRRHASRLWLYNLHYFEFLWSLPYELGRELILDWIARHPLARGRAGWEPYPTSLRLVAWCGWLFGRHRTRAEPDRELRALVWPSIWLQAEWLARHIETHLRGNHLLENAAALAFCGACFGGPGDAWLAAGSRGSIASSPSRSSRMASTSSARRCITRGSSTCWRCSRRRALPSSSIGSSAPLERSASSARARYAIPTARSRC